MMARIGIFGGMFDPVHIGHLQPAIEAFEHLELNKISLVPCAHPPHRQVAYLEFEHRTQLLIAACARFSEFEVDTCEMNRNGPSYTLETLQDFRSRYPDASLYLLIGTDAFAGFAEWKDWREIFSLAHIVVLHRPGFPPMPEGELGDVFGERKVSTLVELQATTHGCIGSLAVTQLEISSTLVRDRLQNNLDVAYLVPDEVRELINQNGWYRENGVS